MHRGRQATPARTRSSRYQSLGTVVGLPSSITYSYDLNGNMVASSVGFAAQYDHMNLPTRIAGASFRYGADDQRNRQLGIASRVYTPGLEITASQTQHYLGEHVVVTRNAYERRVEFLLQDALGSVAAVASRQGELVGAQGFDAFGAPRQGDWTDAAGDELPSRSITPKGFTGHEHLAGQSVIHMNGRAYDFLLGRFLGVDPYIQFPLNSQSLNPYSYIMNNPLAGTDPTGYQIYSVLPRRSFWWDDLRERYGGSGNLQSETELGSAIPRHSATLVKLSMGQVAVGSPMAANGAEAQSPISSAAEPRDAASANYAEAIHSITLSAGSYSQKVIGAGWHAPLRAPEIIKISVEYEGEPVFATTGESLTEQWLQAAADYYTANGVPIGFEHTSTGDADALRIKMQGPSFIGAYSQESSAAHSNAGGPFSHIHMNVAKAVREGRGASVFAHELGHAFGLVDRYTRISNDETVPDAGYRGNIMADLGSKLYPGQREIIISNTHQGWTPRLRAEEKRE